MRGLLLAVTCSACARRGGQKGGFLPTVTKRPARERGSGQKGGFLPEIRLRWQKLSLLNRIPFSRTDICQKPSKTGKRCLLWSIRRSAGPILARAPEHGKGTQPERQHCLPGDIGAAMLSLRVDARLQSGHQFSRCFQIAFLCMFHGNVGCLSFACIDYARDTQFA